MLHTHFADLGRPIRLVDACDPVVSPLVGEQTRVVEPEDVGVRLVHEVVRQDAHVAAGVLRSDNANALRIVAFHCRDFSVKPVVSIRVSLTR